MPDDPIHATCTRPLGETAMCGPRTVPAAIAAPGFALTRTGPLHVSPSALRR
jgi:hypothetical protein